jgi:hypothetical protein
LTWRSQLAKPEGMKTLKISLAVIVAMAAMGFNSARADQPHMRAALDHLREARAELRMAEHDKGGWRVRAIRNVDQAIADTERGMTFDRRH